MVILLFDFKNKFYLIQYTVSVTALVNMNNISILLQRPGAGEQHAGVNRK